MFFRGMAIAYHLFTELVGSYTPNCKLIVVGFKLKEQRSYDRRGLWEIGINYYPNYIIKRQQHAEDVFNDDYDVRKSQEKVCRHMHNMHLIN
jgi:hypothetical protein